jgi:hypothetical protein
MIKSLTREEIRDLLIGFAEAIKLDQIYVDALPPEKFHPEYNDDSWRDWRRVHVAYIDQFLRTVDAMPSTLLQQLTRIAIAYEPAVVGQGMLNLFAELAIFDPTDETATMFFGLLIDRLSRGSEVSATDADPRARMLRWLPITDPLRIAEDPECGYGAPAGLVS